VRRSGGSVSTPQVSRWVGAQSMPTWDSVRDVCGALQVPAVQGMIAAGLLTASDVGVTVVEHPRDITELPHRELLDEIARRLDQGITKAGSDVEPSRGSLTTHIRARLDPTAEGEQQAARRRKP
jgi:hypothetical protein